MRAWKAPAVPALATDAQAFDAPLVLTDSSTGARVPVQAGDNASLYVCGITPYDATHLGHAATYLAFDLLHRFWLAQGRSVTYVQNVTDVDDPLLERAAATGVDWQELARDQVELFRTDMEALRILPPHHYVSVVDSVDDVVTAVEDLLASGAAYRVPGLDGEPDGDVYFDAAVESAAWRLGQISGYSLETMRQLSAERGGDPDRPGKRGPLDPLLWRVERAGEPSWDGRSLGRGRPGWHIECSVIARRYLPAPFTVQAGGSDLVFPHHEFSAAHASARDGRPLASHYVHAGMVGLDGEKMSKSKGNLVLVSQLRARGVDPAAIRVALLGQHYRSDWSWTEGQLEQAESRLAAWRSRSTTTTRAEAAELIGDLVRNLGEDLNAPAALETLDRWAATQPNTVEAEPAASVTLRDAVDALLGVRL